MSSIDNADIQLVDVSKTYGNHLVVDRINLVIPKGEFVSILGPSGCGKTTTLNMVAGFLEPSSGKSASAERIKSVFHPKSATLGWSSKTMRSSRI